METKLVKDLKQGDRFYVASGTNVKRFFYLGVHPRNKAYHIVINQDEEPERLWEAHLQKLLNENLYTYEDAVRKLIDELKNKVIFWEKILSEKQS